MIKVFRSRIGLVTVATLAIATVVWFVAHNAGADVSDVPLIPVQKGTLQINVLQGGEIRALQNHEVKSEIELPTKIRGRSVDEVFLDAADGFENKTACRCHLVIEFAREDILKTHSRVSTARQLAIKRKLREISDCNRDTCSAPEIAEAEFDFEMPPRIIRRHSSSPTSKNSP